MPATALATERSFLASASRTGNARLPQARYCRSVIEEVPKVLPGSSGAAIFRSA